MKHKSIYLADFINIEFDKKKINNEPKSYELINFLKLHDWIDITKIDWSSISLNPNAIKLLKENQDKIDWIIYLQIQMQCHY